MESRFWFTSDTHFGHANVLRFDPRPWDNVDDMNEGLIERWNEVVSPEDTVYHLGDVALCYPAEKYEAAVRDFTSRANGTKILIRGNHDARAGKMTELGFSMVFDHGWIDSPKGWVYLTHAPYTANPHSRTPHHGQLIRPEPVLPRRSARVVLNGHVHSRWQVRREDGWSYVNVGVDQWNYRPISLWDALQLASEGGDA